MASLAAGVLAGTPGTPASASTPARVARPATTAAFVPFSAFIRATVGAQYQHHSAAAVPNAAAFDQMRSYILATYRSMKQENILYFLEKSAPRLLPWQRELLRIVRSSRSALYPQTQTKVMNEGCATYTHYQIIDRLHEKGQISDGSLMEFLRSPYQRHVPAGVRRSALFRVQPLCARVRG